MAEERVPVRAADGTVGTVPKSQLAEMLDSGGSLATDADVKHAEVVAKYGDTAGTAIATGAGAARGLTFGLSDAAIGGLGGAGAREALAGYKEANPWASGAGELVGALAPLLATGGASSAGTAARLGAEGASALRLGEGAATAARLGAEGSQALRLGMEGEQALQLGGSVYRTNARAAVLASEAARAQEFAQAAHTVATEGAVAKAAVQEAARIGGKGAAQYVADAVRTVGIMPRGVAAAGRLAEEMTRSLVGNSATSVLGKLAQKAVPMAAQGAVEGAAYGMGHEVSESALGDTELTGERLFGAAMKGAGMGGLLGGGLGAMSSLGEAALGSVAKTASLGLEKFGGKNLTQTLEEFSNQSAFSAVRPMLGDIRKVRAGGMTEGELGNFLMKEVPQQTGKTFARHSVEDLAGAMPEIRAKYIQKMDDAMDMVAAHEFQAEDVLGRISNEVLEPLKRLPGYESVAGRVEKYVESFGLKSGVLVKGEEGLMHVGPGDISFIEAKEFREALDDQIYRANKILSDDPAIKEFRQIRRILEEEIGNQGEIVAGEKFGTLYREGKEGYQKAETLNKILKDRVLREEANRSISLTDYISGAGAISAFGPVGASLALVNKLGREYGSAITADLLSRASKVESLNSAALNFAKRLDSSVGAFIDKAQKGAIDAAVPVVSVLKPLRGETRSEAFARVSRQIQARSQEQPYANDWSDAAPQTAMAFGNAQQRALQFLASKLPPVMQGSSLTPQLAKPHVNASDVAKFERYARAVQDPESVVKDLLSGRLSREGVEALKMVYPTTYNDMRQKFVTKLRGLKKPLPYDKRIQLGMLLDLPADVSLEPAYLEAVQSTFAQGGDKGPGPGPQAGPPPGTPIKFAAKNHMATEFERVAAT